MLSPIAKVKVNATLAHFLCLNNDSDTPVRVSFMKKRSIILQPLYASVKEFQSFIRVRYEGARYDETVKHLCAEQFLK